MKNFEEEVARCYSTWGKTYYDEYYGEKAPYPPVHRDLLIRLLKEHSPKMVLDAGCGPASFLRDITNLDFELYGFDLTPEMVDEGKRVFEKKGISSERIWEGSVLMKKDFQNPTELTSTYDAAVCVGVLPHIPENSDQVVLQNLHESLNPGGLALVEARNQWFALFTLNRYSFEFFEKELIRKDLLKDKIDADEEEFKSALEEMKQQFRMDLPPIRKGKQDEPGYDEVLSRTHNPVELKQQMEQAGFQNVNLHFYHFHCLPPMFASRFPEKFNQISLLMEDSQDWRGYFMASAFVVSGVKA
jgi:SAM-dependent methyltransferase